MNRLLEMLESVHQTKPDSQQTDWRQSFDATVWAKKFVEAVELNPSIATDEGCMIGWFANAIMRGYDHAINKYTPTAQKALAERGVVTPNKVGADATPTSVYIGYE